ncbi:MAG: hypothetical protein WAK96_02205 [Desulfobaccales bacterium]
MAESKKGYRQKQAMLVFLVFACLAVAVFSGSAPVTVGAIMAACALCFWASTLEPEKGPDEHHH